LASSVGFLKNGKSLRGAVALLGLIFVASSLSVLGCGAQSDNRHVSLAPPGEGTSMGPGDVFKMEIVGEKDLPEEYQVASDGTVDLPYVQRLKVGGLEPQQVARLVRDKLIEKKILTDPSVVVSVKEYATKRVTVLGQVQKPGSFSLTPGLTLIQALSLAGGLNAIANSDRVNLTRKNKDGSARTVVLSVEAITDGRSPDIPLQGGDQIYVHDRVF
jgi:protein involved in polysaccharide export with SLBB domain